MYNKYDRRWVSNKAAELGLTVSNDEVRVQQIISGLNKTDGYCPCISKIFRDDNTICPCHDVRNGEVCHCGLFERTIDNPNK